MYNQRTRLDCNALRVMCQIASAVSLAYDYALSKPDSTSATNKLHADGTGSGHSPHDIFPPVISPSRTIPPPFYMAYDIPPSTTIGSSDLQYKSIYR